jgi:acylphosphatase
MKAEPNTLSVWESLPMRRIRAIVSGRVQGVSYRASAAHEASGLGLVGWVKNCVDGRVELEAQGPADKVDALVAWCHHGPPAASVSDVTIEELPVSTIDREFRVRHG